MKHYPMTENQQQTQNQDLASTDAASFPDMVLHTARNALVSSTG
jgi:hypothetical protein